MGLAVAVLVDAAQEGAAQREVVVAFVLAIDQQMRRGWHAPMVPQADP